jgi:acyl-coenzyme A thioesterase PaaI-like protein
MSEEDAKKIYPYYTASKTPATGAWAEKRRVAAAMREVIDRLVSTDAPAEELRRAAEELERFARTLDELPRRSWLEGYAESATAGDTAALFDMSPLIGLSNPISPPIEFDVRDNRVFGRAVLGNAYEGPPGHVHGGIIAAAFDEILGFVQCLTEQAGMTGTLTVRYRAPTPLHRELAFEAWVERLEGRKTIAHGTLHAGDTLCAQAEGVFIGMDRERFRRLVEKKAADEENAKGRAS